MADRLGMKCSSGRFKLKARVVSHKLILLDLRQAYKEISYDFPINHVALTPIDLTWWNPLILRTVIPDVIQMMVIITICDAN